MLDFLQSQVQEGNHSSIWAISQGNPTTEITHFERMGLNGLSSNSLILTREQTFRGREGNSLLVHAHYHALAYSLFFFQIPFSFLSFLFSLLFFTPLLTFFSPPFSLVLLPPALYTAEAPFMMSVMMGFYYFTP